MTSKLYDFAIIGNSPASKLLAALLTRDHKRRCVLLGDNQVRFRLPQFSCSSFAPLTRPEHWSLLEQTIPETLKLLGRIGAQAAIRRGNALCLAQNQVSRETLSHIRTMATLHGHTAQVTGPHLLPSDSIGFSFADQVHLDLIGVEPHLNRWLDDLGVLRATSQGLKLLKDGSSTLSIGDETLAFRQTIFLDDQALVDHLPLPQWPRVVRRQIYSSLLIAPNRPLVAPTVFDIDSGSSLVSLSGGGVNLMAVGDTTLAYADAERLLETIGGGEIVGQRQFTRLLTTDGLPAFGRVGIGSGADVVLSAEPYASFLVPALARWIGGVPTETEAAYFAERLVTRSNKSPSEAVPTRIASSS